MKQIEITTRVNMKMEDVDCLLKKQNFEIIRKSRIEDVYMTQFDGRIKKNNILDILKKCILIRNLCVNENETFKKITYKDKKYDGKNVITEEKINVNIDNIDSAKKLFETIGFKTIVEVKYDAIVYKNDDIELCFQDVENLGLLLEYENTNDFENISNDNIIKEKQKMHNELKKYGLNISGEFDVKKAYELIEKKIGE